MVGCWVALLFGAVTGSAQAPAWIQSTNAVEFFTNLSSRLLSASGYPFEANSIPVYTNNTFVFSPDVRRILQVAANIYDAETNHHYAADDGVDLPTVLRPTFRRQINGSYTNIFIGGFAEVGIVTGTNGAQLSVPLDLNDDADRAVAGAVPDQNIYDVPWIIGVKKGFPNFNEFAMQSVAQITRKLQVRKPSLFSPPNTTNQLFVVGISNVFAFEAWNSYASNYARAVQIFAANDLAIQLNFTNDSTFDQRGSNIIIRINVSTVTNVDSGAWLGTGRVSNPRAASFVVPLFTNITILRDSFLRAEPASFSAANTNSGANLFEGFEQTRRFLLPQFNLSVSNRIRFVMLDTASGRVVDYVQLSGLNGVRDLTSELLSHATTFSDGSATGQSEAIFWQTNRPAGANSPSNPPAGVINQIQAALGIINVADWNSVGAGQASPANKQKQIDAFRNFMFPPYTTTGLVATVPFSPTRRTSQYVTWQANDPLVHFTRQDLTSRYLVLTRREQPNGAVMPLHNIGRLNDCFEPWGGRPTSSGGSLVPIYGVAYKDAAIRASDVWNFGDGGSMSIAWIGKVHRGTPWQTLYLKSQDVEPSVWTNWLGGWNAEQAMLARPVSDRALISAMTMLLNTNSPAGLLSANSSDTSAWQQALGGLLVITNSSTDEELFSAPPLVRFETNMMSAASPQAAGIAAAIVQRRGSATWTLSGEVLEIPELSEGSPWLNTNSSVQLQSGISDEAYEAIAVQLLPRLRQDSAGVVSGIGGVPMIEFSGYDGFPYAVEVSGDLVNWMAVSTNYPVNGKWSFLDAGGVGEEQRFYRSRLLP